MKVYQISHWSYSMSQASIFSTKEKAKEYIKYICLEYEESGHPLCEDDFDIIEIEVDKDLESFTV